MSFIHSEFLKSDKTLNIYDIIKTEIKIRFFSYAKQDIKSFNPFSSNYLNDKTYFCFSIPTVFV